MSINCQSYTFTDCDCFFGSPRKNVGLSGVRMKISKKQDKFLSKFMNDNNLVINDYKENVTDLQEQKQSKFSIARHKANKGDKNYLPFQRKKKQSTFEKVAFKKFPKNESSRLEHKQSNSKLSNRELSYNLLKGQISIAQSAIMPVTKFDNDVTITNIKPKLIKQRQSKQFLFQQLYRTGSNQKLCEPNPENTMEIMTQKQEKMEQNKASFKIIPSVSNSIMESKISQNNKLQVSSSRKMIEPQHSQMTQSVFADDICKGSRHIRINSVHTSIGEKTLQLCRSQQMLTMQGFMKNKGRLSTTYSQKPNKTNQSLANPSLINQQICKFTTGSKNKLSIAKNSDFFQKISRINFKPLSKAKQIQSLFDSEQELSQAFSQVISDKLDDQSTGTIIFKLPRSLDIQLQSQSIIQ